MAILVLATIAGVVAVGLVASPPAAADHQRSRPTRPVVDHASRTRFTAAGIATATVLVASGWVVPSAVLGAIVWVVAGSFVRRGSPDHDTHRIEAVASWIEQLRDVLLAGDQPVGAIGRTVPTAPVAIRPAVRRLAAGLAQHDTDAAFRRFADDVDDPIGDLVAAGLMVAVRRGARTSAVLTSLAEHARQQVDRRRLVEAERAPARREVALLVSLMATLVAGLFVFGRSDYLRAYDTAAGQVFLALALATFGGLVARV